MLGFDTDIAPIGARCNGPLVIFVFPDIVQVWSLWAEWNGDGWRINDFTQSSNTNLRVCMVVDVMKLYLHEKCGVDRTGGVQI